MTSRDSGGNGGRRKPVSPPLLVLAILAVTLVGWLIWNFDHFLDQSAYATAYGARIGCSCRYIEGRDIESCAADLESGMGLVSLSEIDDRPGVKAKIPLLSCSVAFYRGESGCILSTKADD